MLNYLNLSSRKQEKGNKKDGFRKTLFSFSFGISDGTANFLIPIREGNQNENALQLDDHQ